MPYKNKEDQKLCAKRHYNANKKKCKKRALAFNKIVRERNRKYVSDYLKANPCIDCGEADIVVLDFDHVRGKKRIEISNAVNKCWSIKSIKNEIEKCDIRCSNCHRKITHKRKNCGM